MHGSKSHLVSLLGSRSSRHRPHLRRVRLFLRFFFQEIIAFLFLLSSFLFTVVLILCVRLFEIYERHANYGGLINLSAVEPHAGTWRQISIYRIVTAHLGNRK